MCYKRSSVMKKIITILCGVLIITLALESKELTKVGTTALNFLNIDVGSRAVSMGGAYVAIAEDASAMYWNPAGIARAKGPEVMFHRSYWIADIGVNYIGGVFPSPGIGTFGVNATFVTMDKMERTTLSHPDGNGEFFDAGSYAFGISYARSLTDRFAVGFNVKYMNENIYHSTAQGIAFDVGTIFHTQLKGLEIGMSIRNYGPKVSMSGRDMLTQVDIDPLKSGNNNNINANLKTDEFDLPLIFRVGISMDVLQGAGNSNLILAVDALHPNDDVESINVGAEYVLYKMISLRGGYSSIFIDDTEQGLTFGVGIQPKFRNITLNIDYAYQDFGMLNNVPMFSLGMTF